MRTVRYYLKQEEIKIKKILNKMVENQMGEISEEASTHESTWLGKKHDTQHHAALQDFPPYFSLSLSFTVSKSFSLRQYDNRTSPSIVLRQTEDGLSYLFRKTEKNRQNIKLPKKHRGEKGEVMVAKGAGRWDSGRGGGFDKCSVKKKCRRMIFDFRHSFQVKQLMCSV